jgi:hypothetical protein
MWHFGKHNFILVNKFNKFSKEAKQIYIISYLSHIQNYKDLQEKESFFHSVMLIYTASLHANGITSKYNCIYMAMQYKIYTVTKAAKVCDECI